MDRYHQQVEQAADYIRSRWGAGVPVALVTGTGLGAVVEGIRSDRTLTYAELPHFPVSTVASHPGRLVLGLLEGVPLLVLQGRFHLYEGYSPREVTFPIRVLQALGIRHLLISNAAGGLRGRFRAGQIMIIRDHINLSGANPLVGPNRDRWGVRFPDMSAAYCPELRSHARTAAGDLDIPAVEGVYAGLLGPSLETPAEVRYLQTIGAEAVGFSTVQEVIVAVHAGMKVLGLSILTNVHHPDAPQTATLEEIIAVAQEAAPRAGRLIQATLKHIQESMHAESRF
jgi:purine-nucleoside phosphorylase